MSEVGGSWLNDPSGYIQSLVGGPVTLTSGLRSPQHNAAVGGVPNSDHLSGNAFDFVPQGMSMQDAFAKLQNAGAPIKQVLNEGSHVHVAFDPAAAPPADPLDAALASQALGDTQGQTAGGGSPISQTDPLDMALATQASAKPQPPINPSQPPRTSMSSAAPVQVNWLDDALHHATGGLVDKADAAAQALGVLSGGVQVGGFGDRYHKNLTNIRGQYQSYAGANPDADYNARAAGVVGPMMVGADVPTGLFGSALKGGALGAAYGFGSTDDSSILGDVKSTVLGGILGAGTASAGHGIGAAAGSGTGAILDRLAGNTMPSGQRAATNTIADALGQQGITPSQLPQLLSGPKPMTLMDLGGENSPLQRQGRLLTVLPGQPGKDVTDFLNTRQQGQRSRALGDISQLAPNTDTYGTASDLRAARSVDANPLYQQAFDAPPNPTDRLNQLQTDPDIQRGFSTGIKIQRRFAMANGQPFDPNAYGVTGFNSAGDPTIGPTPSWRTWHAGRMGLDDMIAQNRDPVTGALPQTQDVNSLIALRSGLDKELKSANPSLGAADAAWATPSQQLDAMNRGQGFLRADPEQIATAQQGLPPQAVQSYQAGAGRALRDIANDTRDNANIATRLNPDQMARDQLMAAFGQAPAQQFTNAMDAENTMTGTKNFVLRGSNTANKFADAAAQGGVLPFVNDMITGFAAGGPKGAVVVPAINLAKRAASNWTENMMNNNARNAALADLLTTPGPAAASRVQDLFAAAQRRQRATTIGKTIGSNASRGAIAGVLPMLQPIAANQ